MTQENILRPIQVAMDDYKNSDTTPTEGNIVQDLQYRVNNLTTSETRNYFQSLFMPNDQNQRFITNELDMYFNSNPPSLEIMPLEWWKIHSSEYPILARMAKDYLTVMSTSVPCKDGHPVLRLLVFSVFRCKRPDRKDCGPLRSYDRHVIDI
jgi:hAT family C-terminal dimerisation region